MPIYTPRTPPPNPDALRELQSENTTLLFLWLRSGEPLGQYLSKRSRSLRSPLLSPAHRVTSSVPSPSDAFASHEPVSSSLPRPPPLHRDSPHTTIPAARPREGFLTRGDPALSFQPSPMPWRGLATPTPQSQQGPGHQPTRVPQPLHHPLLPPPAPMSLSQPEQWQLTPPQQPTPSHHPPPSPALPLPSQHGWQLSPPQHWQQQPAPGAESSGLQLSSAPILELRPRHAPSEPATRAPPLPTSSLQLSDSTPPPASAPAGQVGSTPCFSAAATTAATWPREPPARPPSSASAAASASAPAPSKPRQAFDVLMSAQKQLGSGGATAAPGKRLAAVGKRKLADATAGHRRVREQLRPPEAPQLEWLASQDAFCFLWHFADGSTSARPLLGGAAAASASRPFDPYTQAEVVGCSIYSGGARVDGGDGGDGGSAVHFDLRQQGDAGGGGALVEAAWIAVAKLLCGEEQAVMIVPNAQLVLRTLLLVLPELCPGDAGLEALLCDASALDVSRWIDPVVLAWLCDSDLPEEQLQLPQLYAAHLPAEAAAAAARAADKDGEAELRSCWRLVEQLNKTLSATAARSADGTRAIVVREMAVVPLLAGMELAGMAVHLPTLRQPLAAVEARQAALTRQSERLLGRAINLASPQQVSEALYVTLQLPKPQGGEAAAKAGHGSTADAALQALVRSSPQCPLPSWVLQYREVSKLRSAFLEPHHAAGSKLPPALLDGTVPSARRAPPWAQAAPTHPSAQPGHLGGSARPLGARLRPPQG